MTAALTSSPRRRSTLRDRIRPDGGKTSKLALAGVTGVLVVVAVAVVGPLLAPYPPNSADFHLVLAPPLSPHHLLGTDQLGRDVLSRMLYGARTTLEAGIASTLLGGLVGLPIGIAAGYFRGPLDLVLMRLIDLLLAFPFLLLAVGLAAVTQPSLWNVVLALGVSQVPQIARIARGTTLEVRDLDYVQAAVVNGERDITIMTRHVLPSVLRPVVTATTVAVPASIVGAAVLSFLGLGVQPPTADWGAMLAQAQSYLYQAPWLGVFPGIAIFLAALCFNLLGDGVSEVLDPRGHR